jgi:hypothetical protein
VPNAPTNVVATAGDAQVSVSFTASVANGSIINHYSVTPYVGTTAGTPVTGIGSPILVTGLNNGTAYTFEVTAVDLVSGASTVATSSSVIPISIPNAPTEVVATAGNKQVSVAFTVPVFTGGASIIDYTITPYIGAVAGTPVTENANPIVVTGLTNETAYTFTVIANNSAGASLASAASNVVTPSIGTELNQLIENKLVTVRNKGFQLNNNTTLLQVYNMVGVCIISKQNVSASTLIKMPINGVYLVKVKTDNGVTVQKIFIK